MGLFSKPKRENVAVIDIGSSSVGGALVHFQEGQLPIVCYVARVALGSHDTIALTNSMLRALEEVGDRLVREGSPQLREVAGSGSVGSVLVTVSSPWQASAVETKVIQKDGGFVFTKSLEREFLQADTSSDDRLITRCVIATLLNGYATRTPYDKKVNRAEIIVLTSSLESRIVDAVGASLKKVFHTKDMRYTGFASPAFSVLRELYPHEKDVLIVAVTGEETDIASVKRDHLVDVGSVPRGTNALIEALRTAVKSSRVAVNKPPAESQPKAGYIDTAQNARFSEAAGKAERDWLSGINDLLKTFAGRHALPRTVFLIADEEVRGFLKQELEDPSLRGLWLSDEPISVIPVLPEQFSTFLRVQGDAQADLGLDILALYAAPERR